MTTETDYMQTHERIIIQTAVTAAIAAGYSVSVYDGGEYVLKRSKSVADVMDKLCTTDSDILSIHNAERRIGTITLVYGNEPGVVISDHTDTEEMRGLLYTADAVATQIGEGAYPLNPFTQREAEMLLAAFRDADAPRIAALGFQADEFDPLFQKLRRLVAQGRK